MLHHVHLLVANFVCLLFGAGQVAYNRFIRDFFAERNCLSWLKRLMRDVELNQTVKLRGHKIKVSLVCGKV